jgi:CelD/BcsL family acetyltransferase involved in cellulose biosynthesis
MAASDVALRLRIGARTVWTLRRRLVRRALTLEEALVGVPPALPPLDAGDEGYFITALPAALVAKVARLHPRLKAFVRQRYPRSYADLGQSFDCWLAGLSGKSRSTLKRKARKLAERCGGALDVRCYRTAEEMALFYAEARAVSARSYQERLLAAGLPEGPEALAEMRKLAARDRARGWLLFVDGRAISYLYAPAEGLTLLYAYVGYDPDFAELSPGTVLQIEVMRELMAEGRFQLFDFTDGDGQHKRQFATGSVDCVDLLLVRPTLANLAGGHLINGFDAAVALAKKALSATGAAGLLKRVRR